MFDQISSLRKLVNDKKVMDSHPMRIIAVTSGKGGVGKTNFTVNLALALIEYDYKVIIMDGDLGLANVDVACGLAPKYSLKHLLSGEKKIEEIILSGPKGIGILPGGSGVQEMQNLEKEDLQNVVVNLGRLERMADILIIDTGAGLNQTVMNFLLAADDIILITTPEPTSLTDAYGLLKALHEENRDRKVNIVVNKVHKEGDAQSTFSRLNVAVRRFLDGSLNLLGWVYDDPHVSQSIMKQEPLGLLFPSSTAYRCIQWIAGNVAGIYQNPPQQSGGIRKFLGSLFASH